MNDYLMTGTLPVAQVPTTHCSCMLCSEAAVGEGCVPPFIHLHTQHSLLRRYSTPSHLQFHTLPKL